MCRIGIPSRSTVLFISLVVFNACILIAPRAIASNRPNILIVFADDWGRIAGSYAKADGPGTLSDMAHTPNFDRIAEQGVLFRRAFVNAPSCTPCRSSLLSGQHFWRTGRAAILAGAIWDPSIPAFPLLLKDSGYHIGKSYKVWSPGTPADAPYGQRDFAYEKAGRDFNGFSTQVTKAVASGQSFAAAKERLLSQVRSNFRDFLEAKNSDQPFCYWFGPTNTHRKWVQGHGKALWGTDPKRFEGKLPKFLPDVPEVWEDLNDYFGEIAALDESMGVLVEELKSKQLFDNTLIVISGDHGPPGFTHGKCNLYDFGTSVSLAIAGPGVKGGRVIDDLVSIPDVAPTILEAGNLAIPETMTAKSLWPILRSEKQGVVDPSRKFVLMGRERHVDRAREGFAPYPMRAIRTHDYSLIVNFRPDRFPMGDPVNLEGDVTPDFTALKDNTYTTFADMDSSPTKAWLVQHRNESLGKYYYDLSFAKRPRLEMYDLSKDPFQVHNVANDPAYRGVKQELEEMLLAELRRTGDPRMIDDGSFFETPPMAGIPGRKP